MKDIFIFVFSRPWLLIYLGCTIAFLCQLFSLIQTTIKPSQTVTRVEKKDLIDIPFPVLFKICIKPAFNAAELLDAVYLHTGRYFLGENIFNKSVHGWAGHRADGTIRSNASGKDFKLIIKIDNQPFIDIQERVFIKTVDLIRYIMIVTRDNEWIYLPPTEAVLKRPNYPHNCLTLDISEREEVKKRGVMKVGIIFNTTTGYGTEVILEDRQRSVSRSLQYNRLSYTGPSIQIQSLDSKLFLEFVAELKLTVFVEEDTSKKCKIYPNSKFASYDDCDEKYMLDIFNKLKCIPAWITNNMSMIATSVHNEGGTTSLLRRNLAGFATGTNRSACHVPCTRTYIQTSYLSDQVLAKDSRIYITFDNMLVVSTTEFPKFNLADSLAALGGSLGLWLGLGVVQFLELIANTVAKRN